MIFTKQNIRLISSVLIISILLSTSIVNVKSSNTDKQEKYAILINATYGTGTNYISFEYTEENRTQSYKWNLIDMSRYYNAFKELGYDDEHIIILFTKINDYPTPNDIDFNDSFFEKIDGPSNKINIIKNFKKLRSLDENDQVFIMFIGHGLDGRYFLNQLLKREDTDGIKAHNTFFALEPRFNYIYKNIFKYQFTFYRIFFPYCAFWDYELALYTKFIKSKIIFLFGSCNSGGFINDLSSEKNNRIIITASRENELADVFLPAFRWATIGYREPNNEIIDADFNNDTMISVSEAYIYAAQYAYKFGKLGTQHALLDDNGDKIGHFYNETGFNQDEIGMDGHISSDTFL